MTMNINDFPSMRTGIHGLQLEDVPLTAIAQEAETPVYVYSKSALLTNLESYKKAFSSFPTLLCYAVKANSHIALLREIGSQGFGADIVSVGELERALLAGIPPQKIVYSGVGKLESEIHRALEVGILRFNAESIFELKLINTIAKSRGIKAQISLRINPDIDAKTDPKITTGLYSTKFGISLADLPAAIAATRDCSAIELNGLACHLGSQMTQISPIRDAARSMAQLTTKLRADGFHIQYLDMGGGLGIRYHHEDPPQVSEYSKTILNEIQTLKDIALIMEPGRSIIGNTAVLLTRVIGIKETPTKRFVIIDAAMNDLMRPSMYNAYHEIVQVNPKSSSTDHATYEIVGPVCESSDYFGKDRSLTDPKEGDLLAICSAGAYGMTMASNYNSRPKPAEVLVDKYNFEIITKREPLSRLWEMEAPTANRGKSVPN